MTMSNVPAGPPSPPEEVLGATGPGPDDVERTGAPVAPTAPVAAFDAARFRQVLGHFCTGVSVVTTLHDGRPVGFTAQSFTSVSLDPPLVAFCPATTSASWASIRTVGSFCANILSDEQEALGRVFATRGADRFTGVGWEPSATTRSPVLAGVLAWVDCRVHAVHEAGDHLLVVGRVVDLGISGRGSPLLFYRGGYGRFAP